MPPADPGTSTTNDAEAGEPGRVIQERDERPCIFRYITAVVRAWGLVTAIAIWACTVVLLKDYTKYVYTPWYLLFMSVVFTFFELTWILNKCACCRDDGGCCCNCWKAILWVDDWKKFILYSLIAIPCFLKGIVITLAVISGLLVIATGIFYLLKTIKRSDCVERRKRVIKYVETTSPKAGLVEHEVQSATDQPVNYGTGGETPVQTTPEMPGSTVAMTADPVQHVTPQPDTAAQPGIPTQPDTAMQSDIATQPSKEP